MGAQCCGGFVGNFWVSRCLTNHRPHLKAKAHPLGVEARKILKSCAWQTSTVSKRLEQKWRRDGRDENIQQNKSFVCITRALG